MSTVDHDRLVLSLTDTQLESFSRDWADRTRRFVKCIRLAGTGDLGRDVVGFESDQGFEGRWHNFQCKQYGRPLPTAEALIELGKILYFASIGEFSLPSGYTFVVPRRLNRDLETLIHSPEKLKAKLLQDWDKSVAGAIIENVTLSLSPALRNFIDAFDFKKVDRVTLDEFRNSPQYPELLSKWFGVDPGPAPAGQKPVEVQDRELPYVTELVSVYADYDKAKYRLHSDLPSDSDHLEHFNDQRENFFHAEEFKRYFRDCTAPGTIESLENDLLQGIKPTASKKHADSLERVNSILEQATNVQIASSLSKHTGPPVRQGACHHFVNDGKLKWKK